MFGLNKPRSTLGRFIDSNGMTQQRIINKTGISQTTMANLCGDEEYKPSDNVKIKIVGALRREGYDVEIEDFW